MRKLGTSIITNKISLHRRRLNQSCYSLTCVYVNIINDLVSVRDCTNVRVCRKQGCNECETFQRHRICAPEFVSANGEFIMEVYHFLDQPPLGKEVGIRIVQSSNRVQILKIVTAYELVLQPWRSNRCFTSKKKPLPPLNGLHHIPKSLVESTCPVYQLRPI